MKKTAVFLIVAVLMAVFFAGCSSGADKTGHKASGGVSSPAENINLKNIDITTENDKTVLTLSLLSGSRVAGYPESKLTQLPAYEVTMLSQPQRLMIRLDDISFWDYEDETDWDLSGLVTGVFREVPAKDDSLIIYFQLTQNAAFSVEEAEGSLIIQLTPGAQNAGASFFCVANAFYEHQEGTWPEDINMTPVLCSDKQNKLLISQPFSSLVAAGNYAKSVSDKLNESLPDIKITVTQLNAGALPDFATDIDYSVAEGRSVLKKEGRLINTPVLLQNGRYLAAASDGRVAFSRSYQPGEPSLEQDSYLLSEKLWILETNGRIYSVDTPEFFFIDRAAFSADGRYIALLDVSIENRVLYVYDFEKSVLINLGEEGFGSQTAAFAWSDASDTLYAMSGDSAMQLKNCAFAEDGSFSISAVEERAGSEGNLAVSQNRVYFADSVDGVVYDIGETRQAVTEGIDIKISSDGKKLLVLETIPSGSEQVLTNLKLYDIESGNEVYIIRNVEIADFCFLGSGSVYYTDASAIGADDEYPYGLYAYDMVSGGVPELIGLTTTSEIDADGGQLALIDYIGDGENGFYATYLFEPGA